MKPTTQFEDTLTTFILVVYLYIYKDVIAQCAYICMNKYVVCFAYVTLRILIRKVRLNGRILEVAQWSCSYKKFKRLPKVSYTDRSSRKL